MHVVRIVVAFAVASSLAAPAVATNGGKVFDAEYSGTFVLTFGSGPSGEDELRFSGVGFGTLVGKSAVDGYSRTVPGPDGCAHIVHDEVTVTAAHGAALLLENAGADCVDSASSPGRVIIRGSGTSAYVGGTGSFDGAVGEGMWSVVAEVLTIGVGRAEGTFGPLVFEGRLATP